VKELLGRNQEDEKSVREQPALRKLQQSIAPEDLIDRYALLGKMSQKQLTAKGKQSIERSMLMELLYRMCNFTRPEIGRLLGGIDYSAVSQARKRLPKKDPQ
jgi:chromosomal replication initiation ATPase DnaA